MYAGRTAYVYIAPSFHDFQSDSFEDVNESEMNRCSHRPSHPPSLPQDSLVAKSSAPNLSLVPPVDHGANFSLIDNGIQKHIDTDGRTDNNNFSISIRPSLKNGDFAITELAVDLDDDQFSPRNYLPPNS